MKLNIDFSLGTYWYFNKGARPKDEILNILGLSGITPVTADDVRNIILDPDGAIGFHYCDSDDTMFGYNACVSFFWSKNCGLNLHGGEIEICGYTDTFEEAVEEAVRRQTELDYEGEEEAEYEEEMERRMRETYAEYDIWQEAINDVYAKTMNDPEALEEFAYIADMINQGIAKDIEGDWRWKMKVENDAPEVYASMLNGILDQIEDLKRVYHKLENEMWGKKRRTDNDEAVIDMGQLLEIEAGIETAIRKIRRTVVDMKDEGYEDYIRIAADKNVDELVKEAAKKGVKL